MEMKFKGIDVPLEPVKEYRMNTTGLEDCPKCKELETRGWGWIDRGIMHKNGHVWPGYAGEPDGGDYGGGDF